MKFINFNSLDAINSLKLTVLLEIFLHTKNCLHLFFAKLTQLRFLRKLNKYFPSTTSSRSSLHGLSRKKEKFSPSLSLSLTRLSLSYYSHTRGVVVGKKAGIAKREGWCRRHGYENVYGIALCSHRLADSTRWCYDNKKYICVRGVSLSFSLIQFSLSQPRRRLGFFEDFFLIII